MLSGRFADRADAGRQLAARLAAYMGRADVTVLGLPRGGVAVATEVARALGAPLDVCLVRKLGVPGHEELAMGAIAERGVQVTSEDLIRELDIPPSTIERVAARERVELDRRGRLYRGDRPPAPVHDRTVILVDDGLATGATMEAAIVALRSLQPARLVAAAPVGAREACERLGRLADQIVCLRTPEPFSAVGVWYEDFREVTDADVVRALRPAAGQASSGIRPRPV
jgi:putative phosphoribosyl transferase